MFLVKLPFDAMIPCTYEIIKHNSHEIKKKVFVDETLLLQLCCLRFEIKKIGSSFRGKQRN